MASSSDLIARKAKKNTFKRRSRRRSPCRVSRLFNVASLAYKRRLLRVRRRRTAPRRGGDGAARNASAISVKGGGIGSVCARARRRRLRAVARAPLVAAAAVASGIIAAVAANRRRSLALAMNAACSRQSSFATQLAVFFVLLPVASIFAYSRI